MRKLRRLFWFVTKRMIGLTMAVGLLILTLYMAMNTSAITILLKDGMALRAQVIMMNEEPSSLNKYFKDEFVELDSALTVGQSDISPYANYNITGIDHRVDMEWMWCWPWDRVARADFVESVPKIDGKIKSSMREAAEQNNPDSVYPPAWRSARYRATLEKIGGQWKIASISLLEYTD